MYILINITLLPIMYVNVETPPHCTNISRVVARERKKLWQFLITKTERYLEMQTNGHRRTGCIILKENSTKVLLVRICKHNEASMEEE